MNTMKYQKTILSPRNTSADVYNVFVGNVGVWLDGGAFVIQHQINDFDTHVALFVLICTVDAIQSITSALKSGEKQYEMVVQGIGYRVLLFPLMAKLTRYVQHAFNSSAK